MTSIDRDRRAWERASFRGEIDELDFGCVTFGEMAGCASGNFQQTVGVIYKQGYIAANDSTWGTQNWWWLNFKRRETENSNEPAPTNRRPLPLQQKLFYKVFWSNQ